MTNKEISKRIKEITSEITSVAIECTKNNYTSQVNPLLVKNLEVSIELLNTVRFYIPD